MFPRIRSCSEIFEHSKVFFATLGYASEVFLQSDKQGIADDAVSVVIPEASIYIPFAELVDIAKEIERLTEGGRASHQGACPCNRHAVQ